MKIPSKFKIGGQNFEIRVVDRIRDTDNYGEFSYCPPLIELASKYYDNQGISHDIPENQLMNTFWHEVFHSFNYMLNNGTDENLAQSFANFMCEFEDSKEYGEES
jgi:hypothetical protein